jgi:acetoin utilization protein AcuB
MLVRDRMTRSAVTINPKTSLQDALDLMHSKNFSRLPVLDSKDRLVGIVSEKQLLRYSPSEATTLDVYEIRGVMSRTTVDKVMSRNLITITPDTPLEDAARLMDDNDISGMPVVDGDKVLGMITRSDLFRAFLETLGARSPGIRLTVVMPCQPGQIASLAQAIANAGGNIISLGTFLAESSDNGEITVKVDQINKETLVAIVKPLVVSIVDVREKGVV